MKFLVVTDLHQKSSAIEWINSLADEYDVRAILFLGDVTDFGTCEDGEELLKKFKREVYFIPGNCDPPEITEKVAGIVHSVNDTAFEIDGIRFAALGASNPTTFRTPNELSEIEIKEKLEKISSPNMILMTHAPSYGILDEIPSGLNVGSPSIRAIGGEFHPIAALSGHIHEAIGIKSIEGTLFINPGPARDGHAVILDVEGDIVSAKAVGPCD